MGKMVLSIYKDMQTHFEQASMEKADEILYIEVDHADDLVNYYILFETGPNVLLFF
jgi:hypothetical protein